MLMSKNKSNKLQIPDQDSSETTKLLPRSNQDVSFVEPRKKCQYTNLEVLIILLLIFIGGGLVAYVPYVLLYRTTKLTVLNFNVWGLPLQRLA